MMLQAFKYWADFRQHIGRPGLVEDARFTSAELLSENAAAAREIIAEVLAGGTLAEWTERFQTLQGQWAPVQDTLEVTADPQVRANGYLQEAVTQDGRRFELVASPAQFDGEPTATKRAPEFNEHGDEILQELGYDWDRILDLEAAGAVA